MVWMEKTQIRQGGPWPNRDRAKLWRDRTKFWRDPPPKKTIILWICLAQKNMWNINWVRSVQLLVTEMIVIWLHMEDSKHWIHPNSNIHLWLKGKQHSPKVLNHIIVKNSQYEASWLILGATQPGSTMFIISWELVSPRLNESYRLRKWLCCRNATQNALMRASIGAWKVSSCGQGFDGSKTLWFLGIKIC